MPTEADEQPSHKSTNNGTSEQSTIEWAKSIGISASPQSSSVPRKRRKIPTTKDVSNEPRKLRIEGNVEDILKDNQDVILTLNQHEDFEKEQKRKRKMAKNIQNIYDDICKSDDDDEEDTIEDKLIYNTGDILSSDAQHKIQRRGGISKKTPTINEHNTSDAWQDILSSAAEVLPDLSALNNKPKTNDFFIEINENSHNIKSTPKKSKKSIETNKHIKSSNDNSDKINVPNTIEMNKTQDKSINNTEISTVNEPKEDNDEDIKKNKIIPLHDIPENQNDHGSRTIKRKRQQSNKAFDEILAQANKNNFIKPLSSISSKEILNTKMKTIRDSSYINAQKKVEGETKKLLDLVQRTTPSTNIEKIISINNDSNTTIDSNNTTESIDNKNISIETDKDFVAQQVAKERQARDDEKNAATLRELQTIITGKEEKSDENKCSILKVKIPEQIKDEKIQKETYSAILQPQHITYESEGDMKSQILEQVAQELKDDIAGTATINNQMTDINIINEDIKKELINNDIKIENSQNKPLLSSLKQELISSTLDNDNNQRNKNHDGVDWFNGIHRRSSAQFLEYIRQQGQLATLSYEHADGRSKDFNIHTNQNDGQDLNYYDEYGQLMTTKQAQRFLSAKFHGIHYSLNKLEKIRKRRELQAVKISGQHSTISKTVEKLRQKSRAVAIVVDDDASLVEVALSNVGLISTDNNNINDTTTINDTNNTNISTNSQDTVSADITLPHDSIVRLRDLQARKEMLQKQRIRARNIISDTKNHVKKITKETLLEQPKSNQRYKSSIKNEKLKITKNKDSKQNNNDNKKNKNVLVVLQDYRLSDTILREQILVQQEQDYLYLIQELSISCTICFLCISQDILEKLHNFQPSDDIFSNETLLIEFLQNCNVESSIITDGGTPLFLRPDRIPMWYNKKNHDKSTQLENRALLLRNYKKIYPVNLPICVSFRNIENRPFIDVSEPYIQITQNEKFQQDIRVGSSIIIIVQPNEKLELDKIIRKFIVNERITIPIHHINLQILQTNKDINTKMYQEEILCNTMYNNCISLRVYKDIRTYTESFQSLIKLQEKEWNYQIYQRYIPIKVLKSLPINCIKDEKYAVALRALLQIPSISVNRAIAILENYPSLRSIHNACMQDDGWKQLSNICISKKTTGTKVLLGTVLAKRLVRIFTSKSHKESIL